MKRALGWPWVSPVLPVVCRWFCHSWVLRACAGPAGRAPGSTGPRSACVALAAGQQRAAPVIFMLRRWKTDGAACDVRE